ncbi:MAG: sulfatase/phosphatase domain-containing protein, partial [Planctomycetota bacterium]|nr:sulfatase/phosphatase domain-containing protein [Planctomycetota bacterium]
GGTYKNDPNLPNAFGNQLTPRKGLKKISYEPQNVNVPSFLPDTPVCRSEIAQYYESCSRIDQGLGKLVNILKTAGVYRKTVIIFTSDHGMAFPGGKTTVYEGGLRVPYVIKHPNLNNKSGVSNAMISHVDITPSILDIAGAKRLEPLFHGRSILPAIENTTPKNWNQVFASHTFHEITMYYPMRVVRTERYKLIWNIAHGLPYPFASDLWAAPTWQDVYQKGPNALYGKRTVSDYINRPKFELFDLVNDPEESRNVATDSRYKEILDQLKLKLKNFQTQTNDPWKLKWKYE